MKTAKALLLIIALSSCSQKVVYFDYKADGKQGAKYPNRPPARKIVNTLLIGGIIGFVIANHYDKEPGH